MEALEPPAHGGRNAFGGKDGDLPDSVMAGLDKELAVPDSMGEAAKKEGKVSVRLQMSDQEFAKVFAGFQAR